MCFKLSRSVFYPIHVRRVKHLPVGRNGIGHSIRIDCGEARGKYADVIQICPVDALNSLGSLPTQTQLRRYSELFFRREICMLTSLCVRIIPRLCGIKRVLEVLCETIISHENFKSHGGIGDLFLIKPLYFIPSVAVSSGGRAL